jgi:drug/metabolite transporter (DMT)-like permease
VLLVLIAKFYLHETVTTTRWIGVLLISAGVGFVTQGPALTRHPPKAAEHEEEYEPAAPRNQR